MAWNKYWQLLVVAFCFGFIKSLEVIPERAEVEYFNPKYIKYLNLTVKKLNRHSPYLFDLNFESLTAVGNNLTLDVLMLENLSGRFQPTFLRMSFKMCNFLNEDRFIGQMLAKQLPNNWTCPFPPAHYHYKDVGFDLKSFPYTLPFTWASVMVKTRLDITAYYMLNSEKDISYSMKVYLTIIQKPKKSS